MVIDGWTPALSTITRGDDKVHQVIGWFGGEGEKPPTGQYVGETGYVEDISDAKNIESVVLVNDPSGDENITLVALGDNFRHYKYLDFEAATGNVSRINSVPIVTLRDDRDYAAAGVTFRFDELRASDNVKNSIELMTENANFRYVALSIYC